MDTIGKYVVRCAIWYHLKNTHGGVLILVNLQGNPKHIVIKQL